ncbi:hypothetical protein DMP15_01690 [Pseudonocardia sp. UM4_GMWB1]
MDEDLAVGAVLGDFEIRGRLGAGGWGRAAGPRPPPRRRGRADGAARPPRRGPGRRRAVPAGGARRARPGRPRTPRACCTAT